MKWNGKSLLQREDKERNKEIHAEITKRRRRTGNRRQVQ